MTWKYKPNNLFPLPNCFWWGIYHSRKQPPTAGDNSFLPLIHTSHSYLESTEICSCSTLNCWIIHLFYKATIVSTWAKLIGKVSLNSSKFTSSPLGNIPESIIPSHHFCYPLAEAWAEGFHTLAWLYRHSLWSMGGWLRKMMLREGFPCAGVMALLWWSAEAASLVVVTVHTTAELFCPFISSVTLSKRQLLGPPSLAILISQSAICFSVHGTPYSWVLSFPLGGVCYATYFPYLVLSDFLMSHVFLLTDLRKEFISCSSQCPG